MTEKSERVVTYVTPSTKAAIDQEATNQDVSRAELVRNSLHRELKEKQQERITKTTNAEQRIEALIAEARDATQEVSEEISTATQQYHDLLAMNAVYSIASFRLVGDTHYTDQQRTAALERAHARTQKDDILDGIGDAATATVETDARASESRAQSEQQQQQQQQQQQSKTDLPGQTNKPSKPSPSGGDADDADGDMDVDDLL